MNWAAILPIFQTIMGVLKPGGGGSAGSGAVPKTTPGEIYQPAAKPQIGGPLGSATPNTASASPSVIPPPAAPAQGLTSDELSRIQKLVTPAGTPAQVAAQVVRQPYPGITVTGEGRIDNSLHKPTRMLGTSAPDPSLDNWYRPLVGTPQAAAVSPASAPTVQQVSEAVVKPAAPFADARNATTPMENTYNNPAANAVKADAARIASRSSGVGGAAMGPGRAGSGGAAAAAGGEGGAEGFMASVGASLLADMLRPKQAVAAAPQRQRSALPAILQPYERRAIQWQV